jgi:hypothetical protein
MSNVITCVHKPCALVRSTNETNLCNHFLCFVNTGLSDPTDAARVVAMLHELFEQIDINGKVTATAYHTSLLYEHCIAWHVTMCTQTNCWSNHIPIISTVCE